MKFKCCIVIFGIFATVHSASVYSKPIDIPVEIIYPDEPYENNAVPLDNASGRRNFNEKISIAASEFRDLSNTVDDFYNGNPNAVRNLDAKVQLSSENLLQVDEHLPFLDDKESTPDLEQKAKNTAVVSTEENGQPAEVKPAVNQETSTENAVVSTSTTKENLPDPYIVLTIQLAQTIVTTGLNNIRKDIETFSGTAENPNRTSLITIEEWNRLNRTISDFFVGLLQRGSVKTNRDTIVQDITVGVRDVTNNFVHSLRGANETQTGEVQKPSFGQSIINMITSGFQRVTASINNIRNRNTTTNATDTDKDQVTTKAPRPLQNFFNQLFGGQTTAKPEKIDNVTTASTVEAIVSAVSEVEQAVVSTLSPIVQSSTEAIVAKADPATTLNPFQEFANNVGQAINNLNPFNPPSTAASGSQGDASTTKNPIQQAFGQVNQAINNLNPFNPPSTVNAGVQGEGTTPTPIQNFQNAVGQVINNLNPFNPSGSQNEGTTTGPIQQAFSQFVSAINNLNPLNPTSTSAPGLQSEEATTQNRPILNAIDQVGQAFNNLNPFNQGSTSTRAPSTASPSPSVGAPLETIQVIGSQAQQLLENQASSISAALNNGPTTVPSLLPNAGEAVQAAVGSSVEVIQGVASEVINPTKKQDTAEKSSPENQQEIMVAVE